MGERKPNYPSDLEIYDWKGRNQIHVPYPSKLCCSTGIDMQCPDFIKTSMHTLIDWRDKTIGWNMYLRWGWRKQIDYDDEVVLLMFASLRHQAKYLLGLKSEIYEALTQIQTPDMTLTRTHWHRYIILKVNWLNVIMCRCLTPDTHSLRSVGATESKMKQTPIITPTFSIGGRSFEDTFSGAPSGTLTQFWYPASSSESLSISPSTYYHYQTIKTSSIPFLKLSSFVDVQQKKIGMGK